VALDYASTHAAKAPWAAANATRLHDTFDNMTQQSRPLDPPGPGAGIEERMHYLHYQLDSLAGSEVLQGLLLLEGSSNRLEGGVVHRSSVCILQQEEMCVWGFVGSCTLSNT
jgi:hypothetical protein